MAKRNTLRQKYYKETGLHWKRFGKLEAKPTTEYCKWLENELLTEMEQVKKLNIDDVSKPFYCNDANIDEAAENYPVKVCKEQCSECKNVC